MKYTKEGLRSIETFGELKDYVNRLSTTLPDNCKIKIMDDRFNHFDIVDFYDYSYSENEAVLSIEDSE